MSTDSIGRALKVGTLVQGTVAQSGDRLRVSVSLVNAATARRSAARRWSGRASEIFALQDDVAKEVSLFLRQRLGEEIQLSESRAGNRELQGAGKLQQRESRLTKDVDAAPGVGRYRRGRAPAGPGRFPPGPGGTLDPKWSRPAVSGAGWRIARPTWSASTSVPLQMDQAVWSMPTGR